MMDPRTTCFAKNGNGRTREGEQRAASDEPWRTGGGLLVSGEYEHGGASSIEHRASSIKLSYQGKSVFCLTTT